MPAVAPDFLSDGPRSELAGAPRVALVGAGHWMLAEDRIGPRVLDRIEGRYGPGVELHQVGTAALALLDCLDGQDVMVVVDACVAGWPPGEVRVIEPDLDRPLSGGATSAHQLGPMESLALARVLTPERLPRRVVMVLVETEHLDPEAEDRACDRVVALLDEEVAAAALRAAG